MADHPKSPIARWRRVQLAKHLVETEGYGADRFAFDAAGDLSISRGTPTSTRWSRSWSRGSRS